MDFFLISLASLMAGFVDSIVGGGGLILMPALFATYPAAHAASLFGTNKSASIWGTAFAAWRFGRKVDLRWHSLLPAVLLSFAGAFAGAWVVTLISPEHIRKLLPLVLLLVLIYTLARKELGHTHAPRFEGRQEILWAGLIGAFVGFYDGFFGPGTGSFFVFLLVRGLGYDFLHASASAKLLNVASNLAALILFTLKGYVWWHMAFTLALANVLGSLAGTWLALRHGSAFVRWAFIAVVSALILKTGFDAFIR